MMNDMPEDSGETKRSAREDLMEAGEKLFAEHGFNNVSIRQINDLAEVKNTSAVYYHFGNRDKLIKSILDYKSEDINPERLKYLSEIDKSGRTDDPRAVVEALVVPLASRLPPAGTPGYYIRFLERCLRELPEWVMEKTETTTGWIIAERRLRDFAPAGPPALVDSRIELARNIVMSGMARLEVRLGGGATTAREALAEIELLIDATTAVLVAPFSRQCQLAIGEG